MAGNKNSGRKSIYAGKRALKQVDLNPHMKWTHGWYAWEALEEGASYEEYKAAPGSRLDYWRIWAEKGIIKFVDA